MSQRRYKKGQSRKQGMLLPPSIEEYVAADNPVRAIDVYVDSLDLKALGFLHARGGLTPGQPAYPPAEMLKLYLYGYLNRVRSSRRLEQETQRNLEVIWLLRGLKPSYKTIADFRKDNTGAIKEVNKDFLALCKELGLFGGQLVGIDGSFFRGNAGKRSIYTKKRLKKALKKLEKQIDEYLAEMDQLDQQEEPPEVDKKSLQEKLEAMKARQKKQQERQRKLEQSGETQLSEVDEDARLLSKSGQVVAGYNVQIAVDEKHKLLLVCEVTNDGNDLKQLGPLAHKAKAVLGSQKLEVVADSGYFSGPQLKDCLEANILPYVPEPDNTARQRTQGRFSRPDFEYQAELDVYQCPAGQLLKRTGQRQKNGKRMLTYTSQASVCQQCAFQAHCLPAKTPYRRIYRWEHEHIIEVHRERMTAKGAEKMAQRAALAEHPFGTLKYRCGWTHFLLRGQQKVSGEMALLMLGYNLTRVLNIMGIAKFSTYCRMRARNRSRKRQTDTQYHWKAAFYLFFSAIWRLFTLKLRSDFVIVA